MTNIFFLNKLIAWLSKYKILRSLKSLFFRRKNMLARRKANVEIYLPFSGWPLAQSAI